MMCLDKISPDMNRFVGGWKVFEVEKGKLHSLVMGKDTALPENKWIHYKKWSINNDCLSASDDSEYPQGWHVEATKKGAMGWMHLERDVLRKVLCRDMHTVGRQGNCKVGVCRWIKILPEGIS